MTNVLWSGRLNISNEVFRLPKTTGRHAPVLRVRKSHPLPAELYDILGDGIIPDRKVEDLRRHTWLIEHCQFTFPCFAHPAFFGDLLDVADSFAGRVGEVKRNPSPRDDSQNEQHYQRNDTSDQPSSNDAPS